MRPILALSLALALALAGCASDDGGGGDGPTTTTPPGGGDAPMDEGVNETLTHDHTRPGASQEVEVPNGTTSVHLTIRFAAPAGAPTCQGGTARVVVKDGEGNEVANLAAGTSAVGACASLDEPEVMGAPGTWTVEFSGTGAVTSTVTIAAAHADAGA